MNLGALVLATVPTAADGTARWLAHQASGVGAATNHRPPANSEHSPRAAEGNAFHETTYRNSSSLWPAEPLDVRSPKLALPAQREALCERLSVREPLRARRQQVRVMSEFVCENAQQLNARACESEKSHAIRPSYTCIGTP